MFPARKKRKILGKSSIFRHNFFHLAMRANFFAKEQKNAFLGSKQKVSSNKVTGFLI